MSKKWYSFVSVKFPKSLAKAMEKYVARDTHATVSEFVRTAVREKIQKDCPDIWQEVMEELRKEQE